MAETTSNGNATVSNNDNSNIRQPPPPHPLTTISESKRTTSSGSKVRFGGSKTTIVQNDKDDETTAIPRFVLRNLPFHQSWNQLQIQNFVPPTSRYTHLDLLKLLRSDWFHLALRAPLYISLTGLLMVWSLLIVVWAWIYVAVDNQEPQVACGLGPAGLPISFYGAFAFSLETCTTVGYGLPSGVNAFFENCPNVQIAIYFQMIWSMMFNAFLVAFFYSKSAQCDSRSVQVLFSNKALITHAPPSGPGEDPQVRLQVRVYDFDSQRPIIESHVRMYVITKDRPIPRQLRLFIPDDELGGMVFLSIPFVINHHIDLYSMLHPPRPILIAENENYDDDDDNDSDSDNTTNNGTNGSGTRKKLPYMTSCNGLPAIREVDSLTGNQDEIVCPICGESYGTVERWVQHVKTNQFAERKGEYPVEGTHQEITDEIINYATTYLKPTTSISTIREYFYNNVSEIIVVVEGIEPISSGTFSAMQSYTFEDIIFHERAAFQPCLDMMGEMRDDGKKLKATTVDLDSFHAIIYGRSS